MKRRMLFMTGLSLVFVVGVVFSASGGEMKPIKLPVPKLDKSKSLAQALKDRKSTKEYGAGNVSPQVLSNLLWAGFGINRLDSGRRTAPSAYNKQDVDIYVTTADGAYLYNAKGNDLVPVVPGDLRALTGTQSYFKDAAINLVYVSDTKKMEGAGEEAAKMVIASLNTGFVAQNVYLCSAAEGLATVFRISIDKEKLGQALKLRPEQKITGAQTIGSMKPVK